MTRTRACSRPDWSATSMAFLVGRLRSDAAIVTAVFEEEVTATKALLRYLAPVARPAFRANHTLMMRHGQAGLRVYLAGYAAAGAVDRL